MASISLWLAMAAGALAISCASSAVAPPSTSPEWRVRSIDTMSASRDRECHQLTGAQINALVTTDATASTTHVAISSPFDDPGAYVTCQPAAGYVDRFVAAARSHNLHIWIRSHWLSWEGDYGVAKMTPTTSPAVALGTASAVLNGTDTTSYLGEMYLWILRRPPGFWRDGDILTPASEPQNVGILPYCTAPCMFSDASQFNQWLRDSMTVASAAFQRLGVHVSVGWWGLTCENASVEGATIRQMGVFVSDCYERDPAALVSKLEGLHAAYGVPVILGEWGDIWDTGAEPATANEVDAALSAVAASAPDVLGVNYFRDLGGDQGEGIVDGTTLTFNQAGLTVKARFAAMVPRATPSGATWGGGARGDIIAIALLVALALGLSRTDIVRRLRRRAR